MPACVTFRMNVASLLIHVDCCYEATRRMCAAYLTGNDQDPQVTLSITPEDIDGERLRLLRKKAPGETLEASSPEALERLHLCRRIAEVLPAYDRILFHGSALAVDGRGVLFTAKSGTGKSTHTRLWRQVFGDRVKMVNDDKPFLHVRPDGVTVYGTPWRGKHGLGENMSAPLEAIYFLNRAADNRVERVSPRELYPLLLQQTYTPDDPAAMAKTLALVEQLSRNTGLLRLYCNMEPQAAVTAYQGIDSE